jgi:hypothetical protein
MSAQLELLCLRVVERYVKNTRTIEAAMRTHFSPKSICIWWPGAVSNRTVASSAGSLRPSMRREHAL